MLKILEHYCISALGAYYGDYDLSLTFSLFFIAVLKGHVNIVPSRCISSSRKNYSAEPSTKSHGRVHKCINYKHTHLNDLCHA